MGSSKYEYDPEGLDRDFKYRNAFYAEKVDPVIAQCISADSSKENIAYMLSDDFVFPFLELHTGTFRLSLEGIRDHVLLKIRGVFEGRQS